MVTDINQWGVVLLLLDRRLQRRVLYFLGDMKTIRLQFHFMIRKAVAYCAERLHVAFQPILPNGPSLGKSC